MHNANLSQTDVFLDPHDYQLSLLSQELETPSDNPSYQESHTWEKLFQDDPFFTQATNLGLSFTLPHFATQDNYEELHPTDNPSTVPTFTKADNGHALKMQLVLITHLQVRIDPNKVAQLIGFPMSTLWGALIERICRRHQGEGLPH